MIGLIQRVSGAKVDIDGQKVGRNWAGIARIGRSRARRWGRTRSRSSPRASSPTGFSPTTLGKMNRSVREVGGALLLVPQFTLAADTSGGLRPSFSRAAPPAVGAALFDALVAAVAATASRTRAAASAPTCRSR